MLNNWLTATAIATACSTPWLVLHYSHIHSMPELLRYVALLMLGNG